MGNETLPFGPWIRTVVGRYNFGANGARDTAPSTMPIAHQGSAASESAVYVNQSAAGRKSRINFLGLSMFD